MKPIIETHSLTSSNISAVQMTLSRTAEDEAHLIEVLQSGIYSDKIMAVLREYGANAWDANRQAGRGDQPIEVHIPEHGDPELRIRDNGPGLSHEQIVTVFSKYGRSTKRDSNLSVGSLGLGAKSGFAYGDSFTVTSWNQGTKNIYVASKTESGVPQMSLLLSEPSDEPSGVEIKITCKRDDFWAFQNKARELYQHYDPRPAINIALPEIPEERTVLENGTIVASDGNSRWVAIMGCVPYRLDLEQLDPTLIPKCLHSLSGSLKFNIGEVSFTANREELKYTTATKKAVVDKLCALVDEYVVQALEEVEDPKLAGWDKRLKLQVLQEMGLDLPSDYEELLATYAKFEYEPMKCGFNLTHNNAHCTRITVASSTVILIDDTGKPLAHYPYLSHYHYVCRSTEGETPDQLRARLEIALKASALDGVPVKLLSNEYYSPPPVKAKKVHNPKHRATMFQLDFVGGKVLSENWEVVTREPEDTDLYVVLSHFEDVDSSESFYTCFRRDRDLAKALGETIPKVYGYKTSDKKPVDRSKIQGTSYSAWRKQWRKDMGEKHIDKIQSYYWANPSKDNRYWPSPSQRDKLASILGESHPICVLLQKQAAARENESLRELAEATLKRAESEGAKCYDAMEEQYPLLAGGRLRNIWYSGYSYEPNDPSAWLDYVRLVDERIARQAEQDRALHSASPEDDLTC